MRRKRLCARPAVKTMSTAAGGTSRFALGAPKMSMPPQAGWLLARGLPSNDEFCALPTHRLKPWSKQLLCGCRHVHRFKRREYFVSQ